MTLHNMQDILQDCGAFVYLDDDCHLTLMRDIMEGRKVYETRPRDVFKSITANEKYRQRVGLTVKYKGGRLFFGDCVLIKAKEYANAEEFIKDYDLHRISKYSHWFKDHGVAYLIADPRFCVPTPFDIPKEHRVGNRSYFKIRKGE